MQEVEKVEGDTMKASHVGTEPHVTSCDIM